MALPGVKTYDFLKEPWDGNRRQLFSLIPAIEAVMKEKAVYHLFDFDAFPSPVIPHQALHFEGADTARYNEAIANHAAQVDANATWETNHGAEYRRLRQVRDIERIRLTDHDEEFFWWMYDRRPKQPKYKHPKTLCLSHHQKAIAEYPDKVKKEKEECTTMIAVYEQFISSTKFHEYRIKLWENRANTDSDRQKAVGPLLHLMDLRATPNADVLKEIEADYTDVAEIRNFKGALTACAILTKLQEELAYVNRDLVKTDNFLIQCIVNKFDMSDLGLQQFMIQYSTAGAIMAPVQVEITSFTDRAAAIAQRAANPVVNAAMTWSAFQLSIAAMDKLLNGGRNTSIYSARSVAMSASVSFSKEEISLREREENVQRREDRVNANRQFRHQPQDRDRSKSNDRTRDRSRSRERNAGHTPAAQPKSYPNWDNSATVPARNVPMHRRKNFEFQHRANAATLIPGETISNEVKLDMYGNPFIVPDAASGYVQYLQPDDE